MKANSCLYFCANCQQTLHLTPEKSITSWFRCSLWQTKRNPPASQEVILKFPLSHLYKYAWRSFWITLKNFNDRENAHVATFPYLAMPRSVVKQESFYEELSIKHLVWMLHRLQSSDVTSPRPKLASNAAADRADVYSGSVNAKGYFPTELFKNKPLHPTAPIGCPCTQHENMMIYLTHCLQLQANLVVRNFQ